MRAIDDKKIALVTGGSRGIGRAIVQELTSRGYDVGFIYEKDVDAANALIENTSILALKCDVRNEAELIVASKNILTYFGHTSYDLVVCNAGISQLSYFMDMSEAEMMDIINVNLLGVMRSIRAVSEKMISAKSGNIICVSSMWGLAAASFEVAYSASKAGIVGLVKSLAKELGPSNIRVNAVAPGVINTDMIKDIDEKIIESLKTDTPLQRIGEPADVAKLVGFLASDDASFITGQTILVDGGFIL